jgi:hypothetical protein
MVAKQKYTLVSGIIVCLVLLGAALIIVSHQRYNASVNKDLDELASSSARYNYRSPLASFGQLSISDQLRTRLLDRGYTLDTSSITPKVCGKEYDPVWSWSATKSVCYGGKFIL